MDTCPRTEDVATTRNAASRRRSMTFSALTVLATLGTALFTPSTAWAKETLQITITTPEGRFERQQLLGPGFDHYVSGPLLHASAGNRKTYAAIRCDGPWGAMRYEVALVSGPGFALRASPDRLLLQVLEHRVQSENQNIDAMKIHCRDTEPKAVQHSVAEIELNRGEKISREIPLHNGYLLSFHYSP